MGKYDLIRKVKSLPDHRLRPILGSGNLAELDFRPLLGTVRYMELLPEEVFNAVRADGDYLVFGNGFRLGASEIRDILMVPREWTDQEIRRVEEMDL